MVFFSLSTFLYWFSCLPSFLLLVLQYLNPVVILLVFQLSIISCLIFLFYGSSAVYFKASILRFNMLILFLLSINSIFLLSMSKSINWKLNRSCRFWLLNINSYRQNDLFLLCFLNCEMSQMSRVCFFSQLFIGFEFIAATILYTFPFINKPFALSNLLFTTKILSASFFILLLNGKPIGIKRYVAFFSSFNIRLSYIQILLQWDLPDCTFQIFFVCYFCFIVTYFF